MEPNESPANLVFDLLHHQAGTNPGSGTPATLAIPSETTVYSKSFVLEADRVFGFLFRLASANTKNVKVELEQGNVVPTEGSSNAEWAVTKELSAAVTSTTPIIVAPAPIVSRYARIKLTGLSGNHADVVVDRMQWMRTS